MIPFEAKRCADLQKVLDITRAMVDTSDLDSLLRLIIDRAMDLLDAERATLFLYDAATDELVSRIAAGLDEIRIPARAGIAGSTVTSGQTVNVPDAYADDRFNRDVDKQTGFRTRSILSLPLKDYQSQLVGVLQVLNKRARPFDDDDVTLAQALAAQAGVMLQRAQLIEHYLAKQRMERDMNIARDIQRRLLPTQPPDLAGFDVAGFSQPADATGGDIYDFMPLPDGRWLLLLADASGHGIGPALVIAQTRATLRALSLCEDRPPEMLAAANRLLCADLDGGRFVTCFLGMLDRTAAGLTYAAAGHGPMLFYRRGEDAFQQVAATGLPLGILDDSQFDSEAFAFTAGDLAVITTDGFFEASAPDGELFGIERVMECVRQHRDSPAAEIIAHLHQAVLAFTHNAPQDDDLTAIVVRRV
ncbi:MAG: GAF domain-containing SpoIIE family protein phosphatase [Planctomycetaceae bacterium]|nr:SpoIIE family protein phosphatase [Planctomycetaceae bacterium]